MATKCSTIKKALCNIGKARTNAGYGVVCARNVKNYVFLSLFLGKHKCTYYSLIVQGEFRWEKSQIYIVLCKFNHKEF